MEHGTNLFVCQHLFLTTKHLLPLDVVEPSTVDDLEILRFGGGVIGSRTPSPSVGQSAIRTAGVNGTY